MDLYDMLDWAVTPEAALVYYTCKYCTLKRMWQCALPYYFFCLMPDNFTHEGESAAIQWVKA
jgi:hypothetical protein